MTSVLWHYWLGARKRSACKKIKWWGVGVVISLKRGAHCLHMVQIMPLHPKILSSLASFKSRLVLTFLYGLPKLSWKWGRWMGAVVVVMHYQYDNWQQNRLLWYGHVLQKDKDWVKKCMEYVDLERGCGKGLLSMLRIVVDELDKDAWWSKKWTLNGCCCCYALSCTVLFTVFSAMDQSCKLICF